MDPRQHLATSRHNRVGKAMFAVGLLVGGVFTTGLTGLLLIMAALVPLGAAVADVALLPGARDTWRSWHRPLDGSPTQTRSTSD